MPLGSRGQLVGCRNASLHATLQAFPFLLPTSDHYQPLFRSLHSSVAWPHQFGHTHFTLVHFADVPMLNASAQALFVSVRRSRRRHGTSVRIGDDACPRSLVKGLPHASVVSV